MPSEHEFRLQFRQWLIRHDLAAAVADAILESMPPYDWSEIVRRTELDDLRHDMNDRFADVDKRFDLVERRFVEVDRRFTEVDRRFDRVQNTRQHIRRQRTVLGVDEDRAGARRRDQCNGLGNLILDDRGIDVDDTVGQSFRDGDGEEDRIRATFCEQHQPRFAPGGDGVASTRHEVLDLRRKGLDRFGASLIAAGGSSFLEAPLKPFGVSRLLRALKDDLRLQFRLGANGVRLMPCAFEDRVGLAAQVREIEHNGFVED